MAFDKIIDSAQLESDLTSVAAAILIFQAMHSRIAKQ